MLSSPNNSRYRQGVYYPKNKEKYIGESATYRSGLELSYFQFLDNNPNCVKWNSEGVKVHYFWEVDNKWHTYYIDLAATFNVNGKLVTYLIELKPYRQTIAPVKTPRKREKTLISEQVVYSQNQAKWKAASEFASKSGFKFVVLTEKELNRQI